MYFKYFIISILIVTLVFSLPPGWVRPGTIVSYDAMSAIVYNNQVMPGTQVTAMMQFEVKNITTESVFFDILTVEVTGRSTKKQSNQYAALMGDFWLDPALLNTMPLGSTIQYSGYPFRYLGRGPLTIRSQTYQDVLLFNYQSSNSLYKFYMDGNTGVMLAYTEVSTDKFVRLFFKTTNINMSKNVNNTFIPKKPVNMLPIKQSTKKNITTSKNTSDFWSFPSNSTGLPQSKSCTSSLFILLGILIFRSHSLSQNTNY